MGRGKRQVQAGRHALTGAAWAMGLCLLLAAVPGLARGPASVADVAEGLQDAVVNISTTQTLQGPGEPGPMR